MTHDQASSEACFFIQIPSSMPNHLSMSHGSVTFGVTSGVDGVPWCDLMCHLVLYCSLVI